VLEVGASTAVRLVGRVHGDIEYRVVVIHDDGSHLVVRGPWAEAEPRDLGFAVFGPGDEFTEHYWRDRWYSVKEVRAADGALKGWYCDVARPVRLDDDGAIVSKDLILDLWVSADRATILRLDEDELEASGLPLADPEAAARARATLDELEQLASTADGLAALTSVTAEDR
jgi:Protein of unknown function (DUF402)